MSVDTRTVSDETRHEHDDDVQHIYPRHRVGPGSRAYCGHIWTPDEAERLAHGADLPDCAPCVRLLLG